MPEAILAQLGALCAVNLNTEGLALSLRRSLENPIDGASGLTQIASLWSVAAAAAAVAAAVVRPRGDKLAVIHSFLFHRIPLSTISNNFLLVAPVFGPSTFLNQQNTPRKETAPAPR